MPIEPSRGDLLQKAFEELKSMPIQSGGVYDRYSEESVLSCCKEIVTDLAEEVTNARRKKAKTSLLKSLYLVWKSLKGKTPPIISRHSYLLVIDCLHPDDSPRYAVHIRSVHL
jgi:hypothetical protein